MNFTKIFSQVSKIKIRSITDSLFTFGVAILTLATIAAIFKVQFWFLIVLVSFSGLFIISGLIMYIIFAVKDPDYLRSEVFQLKKHSLELLGDKENQSNPNMKDVKLITSPYAEDSNDNNNKEFGS